MSSFKFDELREKWKEVPGGKINRVNTEMLLRLSDEELKKTWLEVHDEATKNDSFSVRGWYHTLYRETFIGKNLLDVGSGFGIDGICFALNGAHVTFLDIVESNLVVIERICKTFSLTNVDYFYLDSIPSIKKLGKYFDVIWCQGSLINAPFEVVREERLSLLKWLSYGGRWIELCYPKSRWEKEGCLHFEDWGRVTDGGAPWIEWYDIHKIKKAFSPAKMDVLLNFEFHNNDFIWFDLIKVK